MHAIGIDIGGTKIAGALVDEAGNLVKELRVPTPANDTDALTAAVADLINVLGQDEQVLGAGVAAAGFIDAEQANIIYAPNLSWRNEPFKAKLEALVKVPVLLENDLTIMSSELTERRLYIKAVDKKVERELAAVSDEVFSEEDGHHRPHLDLRLHNHRRDG